MDKISFENNSNTITFSASYRFKFKPSYRISKVLKNSPAAQVGIYPDDILLKINGIQCMIYPLAN